VSHNQRLVYSIAGKYNASQGMSFLDLAQDGVLGLIRAAEKFRYDKGYRFSTYAYSWIGQAIRRGVTDTAETIRYPGHVQEKLSRLYGERSRHLHTTGNTLSEEELANAAGLPADKLSQLLQLRNRAMSLDAPRSGEDGDATILDSIPGGPFTPTSDDAEQASLQRMLMGRIKQLEPAEQQVLISRWGLEQQRPQSRSELADQMSVSREWIRQLERSALAKLGNDTGVYHAYMDYNGGPAG